MVVQALKDFIAEWKPKYRKIMESLENADNLLTFYQFPYQIWHSIYSTNLIESLNKESNVKRGWDKSPNLSIVFGSSSKTQWLSGLYYADFISFYSPTQLCGGSGTLLSYFV